MGTSHLGDPYPSSNRPSWSFPFMFVRQISNKSPVWVVVVVVKSHPLPEVFHSTCTYRFGNTKAAFTSNLAEIVIFNLSFGRVHHEH